jgi:tRNA U38,U39,U40 pseudouridine synthase TruA
MVRSIVGVQLAAFDEKLESKSISTSLKTPHKQRFKHVAPSEGLYLWNIKY